MFCHSHFGHERKESKYVYIVLPLVATEYCVLREFNCARAECNMLENLGKCLPTQITVIIPAEVSYKESLNLIPNPNPNPNLSPNPIGCLALILA